MMTEQFNFKRLVPVLGAVFLGAMVAGHGTTAAQSEAQAEHTSSCRFLGINESAKKEKSLRPKRWNPRLYR